MLQTGNNQGQKDTSAVGAQMDGNIRNTYARKDYIDYLRAAATVAVVFYHCNTPGEQGFGSIVKILFNWCVPIFLMITGALFLDSEKEVTEVRMFRKTIPKIVGILVIWGSMYNCLSLFAIEGISFSSVRKAVTMVLCADTTYCYQFWYLYYIVGAYILLPLIKPWVEKNMGKAPNGETKILFAVILLFGLLIPSVRRILGETGSYWKGAFSIFSGLWIYLLCGCWLSKWHLSSKLRIILFATWLGQLIWLLISIFKGNTEKAELWYGYESFFTWEMSVLLFDTIHRINVSRVPARLDKLMKGLARDSLGIYIFHAMIIWLLTKVPVPYVLNPLFRNVLAEAFVTILICVIGTRVVKKIPFLKKFV